LNLGLCFKSEYWKLFRDLHDASVAIIEEIPAVNNLYYADNIKEILRICSMAMPGSHTNSKYNFDKSDTNSLLAKLLVRAESQVSRKEIFCRAPKPPGFFGENGAELTEIMEISQYSESALQQKQLEEANIKLEFKNEAYLVEMKALVAKVKTAEHLKQEIKLLDKLVAAYESKINKAVIDAKKKLDDFREKHPE
jgi:hypothetical protein